MGYSTQTAGLLLPQFSDNDKPTWRGDVNDAFSKIDAGYTSVATALAAKANSSDVYTKAAADGLLAAKANSADVYTKTAADALLAGKADKGEIVYAVVDYDTPQHAIDAAPAGSVVLFPPGNTPISAALSVTKSLTIRGDSSYNSRIYATNCGGISIATGVNDVHIENIEIAAAVRWATTANTFVGILVDGTTASRPSNHVYQNVFIDGFQTAIQTRYLWGSLFNNVRCIYGLKGIQAYGLSVNNFAINCSLNVQSVAGSRGVALYGKESATDATSVASEGWNILNSLIYGAEIGIEGTGYTHVTVADNILDFNTVYGVVINDNGTNFGGNWDVHDNYIAMSGSAGTAAISCGNGVANSQNTLNRIHHNYCLVYASCACSQGIYTPGSNGAALITGNVLRGFSAVDIYLVANGCHVTNNECLSAIANNIYMSAGQHMVANNIGTVYLPGGEPATYMVGPGGKKIWSGLNPPSTTTSAWGDSVRTPRPAVGSPKGWLCTVAGTPGTWVSEGNL